MVRTPRTVLTPLAVVPCAHTLHARMGKVGMVICLPFHKYV